ncbi:MAG: DUF2249 domain-containing protein, partial [Ginsengibacter sp.]
MAARVSGCSVQDFFDKLSFLGFQIDGVSVQVDELKTHLPAFFISLKPEQIRELDVRPIIDANNDPLPLIIKMVRNLQVGSTLKIINFFEPTPLLALLEKQGFEYFADTVDKDLVETYFYKKSEIEVDVDLNSGEGWNDYLEKYKNHLETIDVRNLPMPQPMLTILKAIEKLPADKALFVYHKKVPVFLLPELKEKKFDFRIKEISEGQVQLLIFKE